MSVAIHTSEDLAKAVRAARREQGLTQDALALASGTGRRFIVNLEAGKPTVRLNSVLAVLAALGLRFEVRDDVPDPAAGDAGA
jgi:y4mF family transcriptional regulator